MCCLQHAESEQFLFVDFKLNLSFVKVSFQAQNKFLKLKKKNSKNSKGTVRSFSGRKLIYNKIITCKINGAGWGGGGAWALALNVLVEHSDLT